MSDLTVTRYTTAQEVLRNPAMHQALYDAGELVMADALINLHGKAHQSRRRMEMAVFNRGFFRHYEQVTFPETLSPALQPCIESGEADLVAFGYQVVMNLTADFAGIDRGDNPEETELLLQLVKKFSEGATMVHSTRDRKILREEVIEAMHVFEHRFLAPSVARRLTLVKEAHDDAEKTEALPRDVITTLLINRKTQPLPEDVFRREIAFYLQAGAHSTANSMVRALHEIFRWRASHASEWRAHAEDLLFIQRCVHESLRLNPASPVAWRRATQGVYLDGEKVDPGQQIVVDLKAANRDPDLFGSDANEFNPCRSLSAHALPWGLSFGYGVHACLGRTLDGGVQYAANTNPATHQYGIVTLLVQNLLDHHVAPHPTHRPVLDAGTSRNTWSSYPVCFNRRLTP